jgi:predicted P-loop ATPase
MAQSKMDQNPDLSVTLPATADQAQALVDWDEALEFLRLIGRGGPGDGQLVFAVYPPSGTTCVHAEAADAASIPTRQIEMLLQRNPGHSLGLVINAPKPVPDGWGTKPGDLNRAGFVKAYGASNEHIGRVVGGFAECDGGLPFDAQLALPELAELPPPSLITWTGGKSAHFLWLLKDGEHLEIAWFRRLQKALFSAFHAVCPEAKPDNKLSNPSRVLRLPGGIHPSTGQRAYVLPEQDGERLYSAAELIALTERIEQATGTAPKPKRTAPPVTFSGAAKDRNPAEKDWFQREGRQKQLELAASMLQTIPTRGEPKSSNTYNDAFSAVCALVGHFGSDGALAVINAAGWHSSYWDVEAKIADVAKAPQSNIGALIKMARDRGWQHPDRERIEAARQKGNRVITTTKPVEPAGTIDGAGDDDLAFLDGSSAIVRAGDDGEESLTRVMPHRLGAVLAAIGEGWKPDEKVGRKRTRMTAGDLLDDLIQTLGERLEFNELTLMPEIDREAVNPADLELLYVELDRNGWAIGKDSTIDGLVAATRRNSYHPVRDYLNRILNDDTIEPIDIATFGETYFGVTDPLQQRFLQLLLLGAVWRAMEPGADFKTCVVLYSLQQTLFKSLSLRALAGEDWFNDTRQESDKDQMLAIHCHWIIEMAELDGITGKKDAAHLKGLLSGTKDSFRVPYGRAMTAQKRGSIFVGTTNKTEFLVDDTGNDRFLVVHINQELDYRLIAADRDRIWKAAMLAYLNGQQPFLSRAERAASEAQNQGHITQDPWLPMLERWTRSHDCVPPFSTDEALVGAGCRAEGQVNTASAKQAAPLLRQLGFVQTGNPRQYQGKRVRLWVRDSAAPPQHPPAADTGDTGANPPPVSDLCRANPSPGQPSQPLTQEAQENSLNRGSIEKGWSQGTGAVAGRRTPLCGDFPVLPVSGHQTPAAAGDLPGTGADTGPVSAASPVSERMAPSPDPWAGRDREYQSPERLADIREERIPQHVREQRDADRLWEQQHLGRPLEPGPAAPDPEWMAPLLALIAAEPGLPSDTYAERLQIHRTRNRCAWAEVSYATVAAVLAGDAP